MIGQETLIFFTKIALKSLFLNQSPHQMLQKKKVVKPHTTTVFRYGETYLKNRFHSSQ